MREDIIAWGRNLSTDQMLEQLDTLRTFTEKQGWSTSYAVLTRALDFIERSPEYPADPLEVNP